MPDSNTRFSRLESTLKSQFPSALEIHLVNQTASHHRPLELESHFDLQIVASDFEGLSRVKRQQLILNLFASEFKNGLHALSIQAYTPEEYAGVRPFSPPVCGGKNPA